MQNMILKTKMCGRGIKNKDFYNVLNFNEYQFKTSRYHYRSTYMDYKVAINKKCTIHFLGTLVDKNLPANAGYTCLILDLGRYHMMQFN